MSYSTVFACINDTVGEHYGDNDILNIVVHGSLDVLPYMIFGNYPDDRTTIIDRINMIFD